MASTPSQSASSGLSGCVSRELRALCGLPPSATPSQATPDLVASQSPPQSPPSTSLGPASALPAPQLLEPEIVEWVLPKRPLPAAAAAAAIALQTSEAHLAGDSPFGALAALDAEDGPPATRTRSRRAARRVAPPTAARPGGAAGAVGAATTEAAPKLGLDATLSRRAAGSMEDGGVGIRCGMLDCGDAGVDVVLGGELGTPSRGPRRPLAKRGRGATALSPPPPRGLFVVARARRTGGRFLSRRCYVICGGMTPLLASEIGRASCRERV